MTGATGCPVSVVNVTGVEGRSAVQLSSTTRRPGLAVAQYHPVDASVGGRWLPLLGVQA